MNTENTFLDTRSIDETLKDGKFIIIIDDFTATGGAVKFPYTLHKHTGIGEYIPSFKGLKRVKRWKTLRGAEIAARKLNTAGYVAMAVEVDKFGRPRGNETAISLYNNRINR